MRAWLPGPARLLSTLAMVLGMVGVVMVESQLIAGVADAGGTPLLRWLTEGLGLVLLGLAASRWRARCRPPGGAQRTGHAEVRLLTAP